MARVQMANISPSRRGYRNKAPPTPYGPHPPREAVVLHAFGEHTLKEWHALNVKAFYYCTSLPNYQIRRPEGYGGKPVDPRDNFMGKHVLAPRLMLRTQLQYEKLYAMHPEEMMDIDGKELQSRPEVVQGRVLTDPDAVESADIDLVLTELFRGRDPLKIVKDSMRTIGNINPALILSRAKTTLIIAERDALVYVMQRTKNIRDKETGKEIYNYRLSPQQLLLQIDHKRLYCSKYPDGVYVSKEWIAKNPDARLSNAPEDVISQTGNLFADNVEYHDDSRGVRMMLTRGQHVLLAVDGHGRPCHLEGVCDGHDEVFHEALLRAVDREALDKIPLPTDSSCVKHLLPGVYGQILRRRGAIRTYINDYCSYITRDPSKIKRVYDLRSPTYEEYLELEAQEEESRKRIPMGPPQPIVARSVGPQNRLTKVVWRPRAASAGAQRGQRGSGGEYERHEIDVRAGRRYVFGTRRKLSGDDDDPVTAPVLEKNGSQSASCRMRKEKRGLGGRDVQMELKTIQERIRQANASAIARKRTRLNSYSPPQIENGYWDDKLDNFVIWETFSDDDNEVEECRELTQEELDAEYERYIREGPLSASDTSGDDSHVDEESTKQDLVFDDWETPRQPAAASRPTSEGDDDDDWN